MKDFLWMLYLAFTLFMTAFSISGIIDSYIADFLYKDRIINNPLIKKDLTTYLVITTCLLWAIWYMYYLH